MPISHIAIFYCLAERKLKPNIARNDSVKESNGLGETIMSEPKDSNSADERVEQTEVLIGRREVVGEGVMRLAKYTAPVMLAALIATSSGKPAAAVSNV